MKNFFWPDDYLDLGVDDESAFVGDVKRHATYAQIQALLADHSLFAPSPDLLAACVFRLATFAREWCEHSGDHENWSPENGYETRGALAKASRIRAEHGRISTVIIDFYEGLLNRHTDWHAEARFQAEPDGQPCTCGCCDDLEDYDDDGDISQSEIDAADPKQMH